MHEDIAEGFLPHVDKDPIMRLYAHYFLHSEFILHSAKEIERKAKRSKSGMVQSDTLCKYTVLITQWLATLYVVVEGFDKMKIEEELLRRPQKINDHPSGFHEMVELCVELKNAYYVHKDRLRIFRNGVFHFQEDSKKLTQLFDENRSVVNWAEKLHMKFKGFFSEYRIVCSVYCAMNGRSEEAWGAPRYVKW